MNILVTGASGFIGRRLVPKLAKSGCHLIAVDRNPNPNLGVASYYQGDICRSDVLNMIDEPVHAVVHLAADVDICSGLECMVDNVYAVFAVSKWAERVGVQRFVYPSTIAIFDASRAQEKAGESSPISPSSLYGMTKYLGECCLAVSKVRAVILRFSYVYGPGDRDGAIATIIRSVLAGRPAKIRDEQRDYLYVDDATSAILQALEYNGEETSFNLGSGTVFEMKNIADMIGTICGRRVEIVVEGSRANLAADASLAMRELGWNPTFNFLEGLREEVAFVRGSRE